ncbi:glycosyl hydrolase family 97 [Dysgonomonas alginatilytica]|uniref:Glycosyl hydrolase family 97 n=1 Tax=Dysgonomonas alginatilytica TaxID=1605892 RepID=A0A2V3PK37_9BACT|nr:glycoside hydrolase family 97 protein [Dysgonomonas alginatilytica]PXV60189.1 glycosyl hydrolase family 97 [Dysgonomonas alginatilytica]
MKALLLFFCILVSLLSCTEKRNFILSSPDKKVTAEVSITDAGEMRYQVNYNGKSVLDISKLGLIREDGNFSKGLVLKTISNPELITETYQTPGEKRQTNTYKANRTIFTVMSEKGQIMDVIFQLSDRGVAFKYRFPKKTDDDEKIIDKECTSFKLDSTARAWMHPHAMVKDCWAKTCPSYEDHYLLDIPVGTTAPSESGWSFPALFSTNGYWVLITESGLTPEYCGTRLEQNAPNEEYSIRFPQQGETPNPDDSAKPKGKLPLESPWRVIMTGTLANIVESSLVTDVAVPSAIEDLSFIKTGPAAWSWGVEKDPSCNYDRQKIYIDYASKMSWPYLLIDALWDKEIGYDRMKELVDYAATKNVDILLWYNSAGNWNETYQTPKDRMIDASIRDIEFKRISQMGVKGMKIDFFPGDGQASIKLYYDIMEDAAKYKLVLNFHGTTLPRGWSRTYPNLLTMEAVKGFEFITFDQKTADLQPIHSAMLPFARNVVGPMDFTPVCFGEIPGIKRITTNGFEIALTVLFQSGIQHFVEVPESMAKQPVFVQEYMKQIPHAWDDIKFIDGYPAKYTVIARKSGDTWYVGGINAETTVKNLELDLTRLDAPKSGKMITDGKTSREFIQQDITLDNGKLNVQIQPNGGFVIVLNKAR